MTAYTDMDGVSFLYEKEESRENIHTVALARRNIRHRRMHHIRCREHLGRGAEGAP